MSGLESSRWASKTSTHFTEQLYQRLQVPGTQSSPQSAKHSRTPSPVKLSPAQRRCLEQLQNHERFLKLLPRLKWKSATLLHSHQRAITGQIDVYISDRHFSVASESGLAHGTRANAADSMFKLDFFEFYVLLERVLVHLLGALGIVINAEHHAVSDVPLPPSSSSDHGGSSSSNVESLIGDARVFHGSYAHRFHANVLAALDSPSNALHGVLGTGVVRQYLGLAKEVRNKWKDVDESDGIEGGGEDELAGLRKRYHQILQDIQLDRMLAAILEALDEAKVVAADEVAKVEESIMNGSAAEHAGKKDHGSMTIDDMMIDVDMMDFE